MAQNHQSICIIDSDQITETMHSKQNIEINKGSTYIYNDTF